MELHDTMQLQVLIGEREKLEQQIQEAADHLIRQYGAEIRRSIASGIPVRDFGLCEEHTQLLMTAYGLTYPSELHRKLLVVSQQTFVAPQSLPM